MEYFDLNNPKDVERALEYFYSLPDDDTQSDGDPDEEPEDLRENENILCGSQSPDLLEPNIMSLPVDINFDFPEPGPSYSNTDYPDDIQIAENCVIDDSFTIDNNLSESVDISCSENDNKCQPVGIVIDELDVGYDYELDWVEYSEEPIFRDRSETGHFSQSRQPGCLNSSSHKEIEFFNQMCTEDILNLLVDETNKYALQNNEANWIPVCIDEIKAFIGCKIMMGIHRLPHVDNY